VDGRSHLDNERASALETPGRRVDVEIQVDNRLPAASPFL
jgi:hypothetical protein